MVCKCLILTTLHHVLFLGHFWLFLWWCPPQTQWVDGNCWLLVLCTVHQVIDNLRCNADHLMAFPVANEVQWLQSHNHVVWCNACHVTIHKQTKKCEHIYSSIAHQQSFKQNFSHGTIVSFLLHSPKIITRWSSNNITIKYPTFINEVVYNMGL